jgi:hypothetical protein
MSITAEGWDILYKILPRIPEDGKFHLSRGYADAVLEHLYPTKTPEFRRLEKEFRQLTEGKQNEHKKVGEWLIENRFATSIKPTSASHYDYLKLTQKGTVLKAAGTYDEFSDLERYSQEDLESRVSHIIAKAFPYGEFTVVTELPRMSVISIDPLATDEESINAIQIAINPATRLKELYKWSVIDSAAAMYLVEQGFAINRHDINADNVIYRQLTDKGRMLKECGTINAYNQLLSAQKEEEAKEIEWRKETSRRQHHLAEVQADLSKNQLHVNIWIALSTAVGAVYGFFQLTDFYSQHSLNLQHCAYFLSGFVLAVIAMLLIRLLMKTRH